MIFTYFDTLSVDTLSVEFIYRVSQKKRGAFGGL